MPTEDWIQESLARLESLEEERNRHEAALETANDPATLRMNAQAIERLDAKIRSLYAELEAAAEQGDGGGDEEPDENADDTDEEQGSTGEGTTRLFRRDDIAAQAAAVHAVAAAPVAAAPAAAPAAAAAAPVAAAPKPAPTPVAAHVSPAPVSPTVNPFGSAPAAAPFSTGPASPFGEVAPPFPSSDQAGFSTSASSFDGSSSNYDDDSSGGGSKTGLIIAGVVLVLGIGGYFAFKGKAEEPPPAAPTGPATVIRAGEIPPDTQGPKTVKGSDVDAIKGTQYKEGRPVPSGGGGSSSNSSTPSEKPKKKDPRAKIEVTDDPLAGIDK